jgi:hypothetical protein
MKTALKKMAVVTGGTYVHSVAGDMDLDAIYSAEIRGKMDAETLVGPQTGLGGPLSMAPGPGA